MEKRVPGRGKRPHGGSMSGILRGEGGGQHHWIRGGGDKEAVGR